MAVLVSLALHAGLGWWALRATSLKPLIAIMPPVADQRMLVQLLTLPMPNIQRAVPLDVPAQGQSADKRRTRRSALPPQPESATSGALPAQLQTEARVSLDGVQTPTPAGPAQASSALNLTTSRAVTSAEQQRRKSPLASAVDAAQSGNSQTPEARAFAKLAPVAPGIVSETIMADGSRLIKFSAGGCMRVVNPSTRNHDDIRKSTMEYC